MNRNLIVRSLLAAMAVVFVATSASAQEVVRKEAPPAIRALFSGLVEGANGDAAAWESFAQAHFAESLLKQQTPAQRAELHKLIGDRFGTIALNGVRREGPDAPLQALVKGSKGEGVIRVEIGFDSPKVVAISVD